MSLGTDLAALFERDLTRLVQEIEAFKSADNLWRCLDGVRNAAGNLALHLEGNLREYVGRQIGGLDYRRERPAEFTQAGFPAHVLAERLTAVRELVVPILAGLSDADLKARYPEALFGIESSVQQILIALYGHLNYHLGQIDYLRRVLECGEAVEFAGLKSRAD